MKRPTAQQQILEDFAKTWEEYTGSKYLINWGKDVRFANTLIEMDIPPDEYTARKKAYFNDPKWWEFGRWDFAVFVKHINKCVPQPRKQTKRQTGSLPIIACPDCGTAHKAFELCPKCSEINR